MLCWLKKRLRPPKRRCDNCRFVQFIRSNGDGQVPRLVGLCQNPASPYFQRPLPRERVCPFWQKADHPAPKPPVGDASLTI